MGFSNIYPIFMAFIGILYGLTFTGSKSEHDTPENRLIRIQALELDVFGEIRSYD